MGVAHLLDALGLTGAAYAAPVTGGAGVGHRAEQLVTPASVMKVQVALAVLDAMARGAVDGAARRVMSPDRRTPGPVGMSLMRDEVSMSVRDLVVAMLTISDNVATDELIDVVGLDTINRLTGGLGLTRTHITSRLDAMLAETARSSLLDPSRGTCTTARDAVSLLQAVWTDRAGAPHACAQLRELMGRQLTRNRIASGFPSSVMVAAKSGGLMGIVRNEAGVVTLPDGSAYAVAIFTRRDPDVVAEPAVIDACIGQIAHTMVDELHRA